MIVELTCPSCKKPFVYSGRVEQAPTRCTKCGRLLRMYSAFSYEVIPDAPDLFGAREIREGKDEGT